MDKNKAEWNKLHSPDVHASEAVRDIPHNDVLANRAKARSLWNLLARSPSAPHFGK